MSKKDSIPHPFYEKVNVPTEETWGDLPGFEGYYQMSTQGRVKSLSRVVPHARWGTYTVREKILKPSWDGHYFHVIFSKDGKEPLRLIHRLVLETFVGPCPEGMECRHLDNDPKNNRLENLCWDTERNNQHDRVANGTTSVGVLGNTHKLKNQVGELYELWKTKQHTVQELAEIFGVTTTAVFYHIKKFKAFDALE